MYDWAGQLRTVETSTRAPFAKPEFIEEAAEKLLAEFHTTDFLRGLSKEEFTDSAAWLYGEMNAIHPFREGNGRANCQFLTQLAHESGWDIAWAATTRAKLDEAAGHAMGKDHSKLMELLLPLVRPLGSDSTPAVISH